MGGRRSHRGQSYGAGVIDAGRDDESAAREVELRWEAHARDLSALGAPDDVVKSLGDVVTAPHGRPGDAGRLTVATRDGVVLDLLLPEPPVRESTRDGIGAVLRWSDRSTPHDAAPSMPGHGEPRGTS